MYFANQTFLVAGLSRSGVAAATFLRERGAKVFCFDDVAEGSVLQAMEALQCAGCEILKKEDVDRGVSLCDVLVLSPGIPIDHPLALEFKRAGKRVTGEAELGALALKCPVVAVTGTNGKTTTVTMIQGVLQAANVKSVACGNIGTPITACVNELDEKSVAVAEISSFQLETLSSLRPHIAVVLNISQDHLNRHYSMENYVYLKSKLLKNSAESEYAALNYDDDIVRSFAQKTKAKVIWFSSREKVEGAYVSEGKFYFMNEEIMPVSELPLTGEHNEQNALAAICCAKLLGIPAQTIAYALKSFRGVAHRMQTIGEVDGKTFIDDSKATNVDSAVKAIRSVKGESVLLLGGKDKGYSYDELFEAIKDSGVVHTVIYGENSFRILNAALKQGFTALTLCRPFDIAVRVAFVTAKRGQNVLLSPASASFDCFKNYEERGERFAYLMGELKKESEKKEEQAEIVSGEEPLVE